VTKATRPSRAVRVSPPNTQKRFIESIPKEGLVGNKGWIMLQKPMTFLFQSEFYLRARSGSRTRQLKTSVACLLLLISRAALIRDPIHHICLYTDTLLFLHGRPRRPSAPSTP
jgi:hypothetical protein